MNVEQAIRIAEQFLPGVRAPDGQEDPRWQAIITVGEYVESDPEAVWQFIVRWGSHPDADLRMAISTCLLEHLLQHHFAIIFPRVESIALQDPLFADTFMLCAKFDQSEEPENSKRVEELAEACRRRHANN